MKSKLNMKDMTDIIKWQILKDNDTKKQDICAEACLSEALWKSVCCPLTSLSCSLEGGI